MFNKVKFDENFAKAGEDIKFISDAEKAGFRLAYSPKLKVYHRRRGTLIGFSKQIFNYSIGRANKDKLFEIIRKPFFLVPSMFVAYIMFLPTLILLFKFNAIIPLIFYFVFNLAFSIFESIKNNDLKSMFILPLIFFILHISYGTGLIYGYLFKKK